VHTHATENLSFNKRSHIDNRYILATDHNLQSGLTKIGYGVSANFSMIKLRNVEECEMFSK